MFTKRYNLVIFCMIFVAKNIQAHNEPMDKKMIVYDRQGVFSNSLESQAVPSEGPETAKAADLVRILAEKNTEIEAKIDKLEELVNVPFYRPDIWLPHTYKNMPAGTTPKVVGWFGFIAAGFLYLGKDFLR